MEAAEEVEIIPEDGGMEQLIQKYFNVDGFVNKPKDGPATAQVTRFDLGDQAAVLRDYTTVLKNWQQGHWQWVNQPDFIKVVFSDNLTHEVTFVEFTENQLPEPAAMEVPPRYITLSRRTVIETSRNFSLGFPFNNRYMATKQGQLEFAMFSARITQVFTELVSRMSLVKLFAPHPVDEMYHNPDENLGLPELLSILDGEVLTTFSGNLTRQGCLPAVYKASRQMEFVNPDGGQPTHVLFTQEKQMILKFGPETEARRPGGMLDPNDVTVEFGMKFRPVPIFSTSNKRSDVDVGSLLAARMEIGNSFPFRWELLNFPAEKISMGQQGRLSVFSENADGPQDVKVFDMNMNDPRWAEDGHLHGNHKGCGTDMYTYYDDALGKFVPVRVIGDMKDKKLTDLAIRGMVKTFLKGIDQRQLSKDVQAVERAPFVAEADQTEERREIERRLKEFCNKMMVVGGSEVNPLFNDKPDGELDQAQYAYEKVMRSVFQINVRAGGAMNARPRVVPRQRRNIVGGVLRARGDDEEDGAGGELGGLGDREPRRLEGGMRQQEPEDIDGVHRKVQFDAEYNDIKDLLTEQIDSQYLQETRPHLVVKLEAILNSLDNYKYHTNSSDLSAMDFKVIRNGFNWALNAAGGQYEALEIMETRIAMLEHYIGCLQFKGSRAGDVMPLDEILRDNGVQEGIYNDTADPRTAWEDRWFPVLGDDVPVPPGTGARSNVTARDAMALFNDILSFDVKEEIEHQNRKVRRDLGDAVGDHPNIAANVQRVNKMFYDKIEKAVGHFILTIPVHRDVFDVMLHNDMIIPSEYVLVRNQMVYFSEGCCIVQAGSDGVGEARLSFPAAEMGSSAMEMAGMLHVAQFISILIKDYKCRWMIPNLFYRRALGGASEVLWSPEGYQEHIADSYYSETYNRPSIVAVSVPVGSYIAKLLHVSGRMSEDEDRTGKYHYDSWEFYGKHLGWRDFDLESVCLHQRLSNQKPNGLCHEGTWAPYNVDGRPGTIHENSGHHGQERPGDKEMRQHGLKVRDTQGSNLFQN